MTPIANTLNDISNNVRISIRICRNILLSNLHITFIIWKKSFDTISMKILFSLEMFLISPKTLILIIVKQYEIDQHHHFTHSNFSYLSLMGYGYFA